MKNRKCYEISLFVIFCITLNYAGKILAEALQLPVWMDAFGTVLAAYVLGPACGAMVGVSVNIIYGIIYSWTYMLYGLVSVIVVQPMASLRFRRCFTILILACMEKAVTLQGLFIWLCGKMVHIHLPNKC